MIEEEVVRVTTAWRHIIKIGQLQLVETTIEEGSHLHIAISAYLWFAIDLWLRREEKAR